MNGKEFAGGVIGTSLSAVGTALQVNEVLQTISLVITILGGLVSLVLIPLLNWYRNAKKDGKIDVDEVKDAAKIVEDGTKQIKSQIEGKDKREEIYKNEGGTK